MTTDNGKIKRCGYIAIVGRPNVGKSTLLNQILGQQLSITSRKPQTTRYQILGIHNTSDAQLIFIDTPGLQHSPRRLLERCMNQEIVNALASVDIVVFMVEAGGWKHDDQAVVKRIHQQSVPVLVAINKIDKLAEKQLLLPFIDNLRQRLTCEAIVPLSARNGDGVDVLVDELAKRLPEGPAIFDVDELTDRSERFLAAEIVREKLLELLGEEVPHRLTAFVDDFVRDQDLIRIHATIWVERPGHKQIVVGKGGQVLKRAGMRARRDLEALFGARVHLETWVKVTENWTEEADALRHIGFRA
jgi:GTP-binding protein Era